MAQPALEAVGVSKRYGDRDALIDVGLVVRPGELHGLLGPNGAGKTTLMRIMLGLVRRDAGSVRLLGSGQHSAPGTVPDGVAGFVDTPAFYPYLTGRRNLTLLGRLDGSGSSHSSGVDQALEEIGLAAQADRAVAGYSAGMRQRLGLAAAMLRKPQLLFLDEPTSSLDPASARHVRALARRLADQGAAVIWSSHDMAEVEDLCAAVTVIDSGRVVFSGTVDDLRMLAPAAIYLMRTSDDGAALDMAGHRRGVTVKITADADPALEVSADLDVLDAYIIALGCAGVAVRMLSRRARSFESLFLELTGPRGTEEAPVSARGDAVDRMQAFTVGS